MTNITFVPADITEAIRSLYAHADMPLPQLPQAIVPLGELFGAYDLACLELPDLSLAKVYSAQGEPFTGQDEKLAGFLFASSRKAVMYINRNDPIPRRRFSVGHELGHYLLHFRPVFERAEQEGKDLPDLKEAYPILENEDEETRKLGWVTADTSLLLPPLVQMESEADRFAALLLMPESVVRALYERYRQIFRDRKIDEELVRRMAADMMVSKAAMARRLRDLGFITARQSAD